MKRIFFAPMLLIGTFAVAQCPDPAASCDPVPREVWLLRVLKTGLTKPDGKAFWEKSVQAAFLPGAEHVDMFHGVIVAVDAPNHATFLVVALRGEKIAELAIRVVDGILPFPVGEGDAIEFQGVARSFSKEPFMLTLDSEPNEIQKAK
jgi:hypothetical protein